jgi:hypothetical protein
MSNVIPFRRPSELDRLRVVRDQAWQKWRASIAESADLYQRWLDADVQLFAANAAEKANV